MEQKTVRSSRQYWKHHSKHQYYNFQANLQMITFYNKIPYFKKLNTNQNKSKSISNLPTKGTAAAADTGKKAKSNENTKDILEFLARGIMMLKTVNLTYQLQGGQGLPNFKPTPVLMGMDPSKNQAPGFLFTTGMHDNLIRKEVWIMAGWQWRHCKQHLIQNSRPKIFLTGQVLNPMEV